MPQLLMITVKYVLIAGSFRNWWIKVFVDIIQSIFNISNMARGLPGVHWQQTL